MSAPLARPVTELPRHIPVGVARRTLQAVRRFRTSFLFGAVVLLFFALLARLVDLQVLHAAHYRALLSRQDRSLSVQGVRGSILDRHGRALAVSRPVRTIRVNAGYDAASRPVVDDVPLFCATLSDLLDGDPSPAQLREMIERRREGARRAAWLPLRPAVDDPRLISRLDTADLRGLEVRNAESREYPNVSWAGHVLGRASRPGPDAPLSGGSSGIESALDAVLSGTEAVRRVRIHPGNRLYVTRTPAPFEDAQGRDVRLTIDTVIQGYCEQALDRLVREWHPKGGALAIVLDPASGDVLAAASRPEYDPTDSRATPGQNPIIAARVEVGSTFKPFTAARALEVGAVTADESLPMGHQRTFTCSGVSRTIHDSHDGAGDVPESGDLVTATADSSNPAFADLANRLGRAGMERLLADLDVENPYGLLGIAKGQEGAGRRVSWDVCHHLGIGFGHGMTMTPLRLACSFAAFARPDARPVRPRLVLSRAGETVDASPPYPSLLTREDDRATMRRALEAGVESGTARVGVRSSRVRIAGKTGTAKKPGRSGEYYSCSFAGYAPADAPRIVVLVMALEPRERHDGAKPYGGAVAGPAVRRIVEQTVCDYMGLGAAAPEGPRR